VERGAWSVSRGEGMVASRRESRFSGHGSKAGYTSGWLGSTSQGRRSQIRGLRAGGLLAVASSTPATQPNGSGNHGPNQPPIRVRGRSIARQYRKIGMSGPTRPALEIRCEKQARVSPRPNGGARVQAHGPEEHWPIGVRMAQELSISRVIKAGGWPPYCCQSRFRKMRRNCPPKGGKRSFS